MRNDIWKSSTQGGFIDPVPSGPTLFEVTTRNLGLAPSDYQRSYELKQWAIKNKDLRYVPSDLLKSWGLTVDVRL